MNAIQISLMQTEDIKKAAEVLSIAMLDNPLHLTVFMDNSEAVRREIEKMFQDLLTSRPGIVFVAKENQEIVGVMRMYSCVGNKVVEEPEEMHNENNTRYRKYVWLKEWASYEPEIQHWHLGPIAVLPSHRKRGIGTSLMERFCSEVDACGSKAYLETDKDENVRFYEAFGFKITGRSMIFDAESTYMERPERG